MQYKSRSRNSLCKSVNAGLDKPYAILVNKNSQVCNTMIFKFVTSSTIQQKELNIKGIKIKIKK